MKSKIKILQYAFIVIWIGAAVVGLRLANYIYYSHYKLGVGLLGAASLFLTTKLFFNQKVNSISSSILENNKISWRDLTYLILTFFIVVNIYLSTRSIITALNYFISLVVFR
jgi:heme A synthase